MLFRRHGLAHCAMLHMLLLDQPATVGLQARGTINFLIRSATNYCVQSEFATRSSCMLMCACGEIFLIVRFELTDLLFISLHSTVGMTLSK